MSDKLDKDARETFVAKLRSIRRDTARIYPSNPRGEWDEEIEHEQLHEVRDRLLLTFRRFGFQDAVEEITTLFDDSRSNLLWTVADPPWREGRFGVVESILNMLDSHIFAYASDDDSLGIRSIRYDELLEILRNLENALIVSGQYPVDEPAFGMLVNSIVACSFPGARRWPSVDTPLKTFKPDCGVPEVRTLLEYKYISEARQVPLRVDEMFADLLGYSGPGWDHLVYVIYETKRFGLETVWREQLKGLPKAEGLPRVEVVIVKGIPNLRDSVSKAPAQGRPSKSLAKSPGK